MALFRRSWTCVLFLMMTVIHVQAQTTDCYVNDENPQIEENNLPGYVVTTIEKGPGVTVILDTALTEHPEFFEINGTQLILKHSLDYESTSAIFVGLTCLRDGVKINTLAITVFVINMNDNSPVFKESNITVSLNEDTKVNTTVVPQVNVTATDADLDTVFYNLTGSPLESTDYFNILGVNNPAIYLHKALDYEKLNFMQLTLYAMDGRAGELGVHTATATITIHILQADFRPPWFQPCTFFADNKVCISRGYSGSVNISEMTAEPLILKPGPLYAVDGDISLNEKIVYLIADGNDNDTFFVNRNTGNITMNKPVNTLQTFLLHILQSLEAEFHQEVAQMTSVFPRPYPQRIASASQANNAFRFSQTTVEISVVRRNDHKPHFEKTTYLGTVSVALPSSSLVMDAEIPSRPLRIFAADEDFTDKINPDVTYQIQNSTDFTVSQDGFLLTTVVLNSASTITLLAIANDKTTMEEASTLIIIDVTPLASTTTVPTTTTTTTAAPNTTETRTTISNPSGSSITIGMNNTLSTTQSAITTSNAPPAITTSNAPPAITTSNAGVTRSPGTNTVSGSIIPPLVTTTVMFPVTTVSTSQSQTTRSPMTGITQVSRTSNAGVTGRPNTTSESITPPLLPTATSSYITVNTSQSQTTTSPITRKSQATIDTLQSTTRTTTTSQAGFTKSPIATTDVVSLSTARITSQSENIKTSATTSRTVQSTTRSSATVKTPQSTSLIPKSTTSSVTSATTASSTASMSNTQISSTSNNSTGSVSSPTTAECDCEEKGMIILGATLGSLLAITLVLLLGMIYKYYKSSRKQKDGEESDQLSVGSTNHCFQDDEKPDSGEKDNRSLESDESESDDPVTKVRSGTPPPSKKAVESSQESSDSEGMEEGEEEEEEEEEEEGNKDSEKKVKSILTKDRRLADDGYKSVWFKEDSSPEAKDDVVLIEVDSDTEQNRNDDDGDDGVDEDEGDDRDSGKGGSDVSIPGIISGDDPNDHHFDTIC